MPTSGAKKRSPTFRRDLPFQTQLADGSAALASLTRGLLTWVLLAGALLLLAGLRLSAALLAGLLTGGLVLLARIRILIAHSEFSFCFIRSKRQPAGWELVAREQRFRQSDCVAIACHDFGGGNLIGENFDGGTRGAANKPVPITAPGTAAVAASGSHC
jgi:hypothetical protein